MKTISLLPLAVCAFLSLSTLGAEEVIHVLQKGETLYSISRRYNVPADTIMSWNKLTDPNKVKAGQRLRIPDGYQGKRGDTLLGIARERGVSIDALLAANGLARDDKIKVGDTLYVPLSAGASSPTQTSAPSPEPPVALPDPVTVTKLADPRSFENRKVDSSVIWPVKVNDISYLSGKVYGVTITSEKNARVKSIASGTVLSTGPYRGFGQVVFLQSQAGYIYVYGGMNEIKPKAGDPVAFGDEIGNLGEDSLSGKPRLYFMVYNRDKPVDPAKAPRGY